MIDSLINLALFILALAAAFAWGYEKGHGDAVEEEIEFLDRRFKKRMQEKAYEQKDKAEQSDE